MHPWQTDTPKPSKEELTLRKNAIKSLREERIAYKALAIVRDYLKEKGFKNASLNMQIVPEFHKEAHIIEDMLIPTKQGDGYLVNTDLFFSVEV